MPHYATLRSLRCSRESLRCFLAYRFCHGSRDKRCRMFPSQKPIRYCWRIYFKALEVLYLMQVSQAFLPSKKACGIHKFRHFRVLQQYPIISIRTQDTRCLISTCENAWS